MAVLYQQTLTELRDWVMSAGDEWAGEGVLTVIYRIRGCP